MNTLGLALLLATWSPQQASATSVTPDSFASELLQKYGVILIYKTDDVAAEDVQTRADRYRSQADSYSRAVASSLGLPSLSFQFIFLRPGVAVDV